MIFRARNIMWVGIVALVGVTGFKMYNYFFDNSVPQIMVRGLEQGGYYCGEMQCQLVSTKAGDVSIWLDGQSLVNQFRVGAGSEGHPFVIPTKTMSNGKHALKAELTDTTYSKNKAEIEYGFAVDNQPLQAAFVRPESEHKVFQGRTLHVQFQVNKPIKEAKVTALSHTFDCLPETKNSNVYEAFVPIQCEENPNEYLFTVDIVDNVGNASQLNNKFQVVAYPFKKHTLHVAQEKVKEEQELGIDSKQFDEIIEKLTQDSPKEKMWKGAFCTPIEIQRVSCDFGTIRTTQHKGRYAHKALDVLNAPKSVVWSTQDGVVVLKERFAASGNTVVVDHGMGILSMFFHLDDFAKIDVGEKIVKGHPVGTIGKTGYATGYHLHWEMRVGNVPVDPMQWTKPIF